MNPTRLAVLATLPASPEGMRPRLPPDYTLLG